MPFVNSQQPRCPDHYRRRSEAALRDAATAETTYRREICLMIAQSWISLAERSERIERRWGEGRQEHGYDLNARPRMTAAGR
jgi:hypothetical protein